MGDVPSILTHNRHRRLSIIILGIHNRPLLSAPSIVTVVRGIDPLERDLPKLVRTRFFKIAGELLQDSLYTVAVRFEEVVCEYLAITVDSIIWTRLISIQ